MIAGTVPLLLAAAAAGSGAGPVATVYLTNGTAGTVWLGGGPHVSTLNGLPVPAGSATPPIPLWAADTLWLVTAAGTSPVYVTQLGGA